ncbi:MAG: response regulator [Pseudomonadota bacterium]|nr:response regulator [Pseudomonadota bacterium]
MEKRRILFVNEEQNVQLGLRRVLHGLRQEWDMTFTTDPRQALELLERVPFEVVVAEADTPAQGGSRFLAEVMRRHPQVVRIVLSDHVEREASLEMLTISHQLLAKPCDVHTLKATLGRALALRHFLDGGTPLKALVSRLESLPSLPQLYNRIVHELQSPHVSLAAVADIVAEDPAMAAKILQLVNSAFFGLPRHVSDLSRAVAMLGLDTVKALVLTAQVFSRLDPGGLPTWSLEALWRHSTLVGALARAIMEAERDDQELLNDALMAGLLHDLGKLVLAANLPGIYARAMDLAQRERISLVAAERHLFGAGHPETGAYLLGLWGLPEPIIEAVAYHHEPRHCGRPGFSVLTAVHAANALSHEFALDGRLSTPDPLDLGYLRALGLDGRVADWRALGHSFATA